MLMIMQGWDPNGPNVRNGLRFEAKSYNLYEKNGKYCYTNTFYFKFENNIIRKF